MKRPLVSGVAAYLIAAMLCNSQAKEISFRLFWASVLLFVLFLTAALILKYKFAKYFSFFCAFFALSCAINIFVHIPMRENALSYSGYQGTIIAEIDEINDHGAYIDYTVSTVKIGKSAEKVKVRFSYPATSKAFKEGDKVELRGRLHSDFSSSLNYDAEKSNASHKIFLLMKVDEIVLSDESPNKLKNAIFDFRQSCKKSLERLENSDFLCAVTIGDKSTLSPVTKANFNKLGLSHVLAVSGLHLSIIAMSAYTLLTRLSLGKKSIAVICTAVVIFYMSLTGFTYSITRAGIMMIMLFSSGLVRRSNDSLTTLFAAALFIVAENPWAIYDVGFQLSFLSTLGIISFTSPVTVKVSSLNFFVKKLPRNIVKRFFVKLLRNFILYIVATTSSTVSATISTLPVIMLTYGEIPLFAVIANLCILFLLPRVISFSVLSLLLRYFNIAILVPIETLVNKICDFLSNALLDTASLLASISPEPLTFSPEICYAIAVISTIALIVFFLFFRNWMSIFILPSVVSLIILGVNLIFAPVNRETVYITFSSSSSCRDTLIEANGEVTVVSASVAQSSSYALAEILEYRNITEIDNLVMFSGDELDLNKIEKITELCTVESIYVVPTKTPVFAAEKAQLEKLLDGRCKTEYISKNSVYLTEYLHIRKLNFAYFSYSIKCGENDILFSRCLDGVNTAPQSFYNTAEGIVFTGKCEYLPTAKSASFYFCEIFENTFPKSYMTDTSSFDFCHIRMDEKSITTKLFK